MNRTELRKKQIVIASSILSFLMVMVLTNIVGELGIAYFAAAMEVYILMQLLFTAALPDVVARFVRSRMAKGQYKNADVVMKATAGYGVVMGLIGSLVFAALAEVITAGILGIPEATGVMRVLAPAFFLNAICTVLQGYFQGNKTLVPTMLSVVLKEVLSLVFALVFGISLYRYGEKVSALLHNDKYGSFYGAQGMAAGVLLATFCVMCFLAFLYVLVGKRIRRSQKSGMRRSEDVPELIRMLLLAMAPGALLQFLMRAEVFAGLLLFGRTQNSDVTGLASYGAYYGEFLTLVGILAALCVLVTSSIEGYVVQAYKKEEFKNARDYFHKGMQAQFLVAAYFTGLFLALAPSLFEVLFGTSNVAANCMQHGFLLIILLPLGLYFSRILMGIGKSRFVLLSTAGSLVISFLMMILLQKLHVGSILPVVYGELCFAVIFCVATGVRLFRILHSNPEWLRYFVLPALAASITGLGVLLIRKALVALVGDFVTCLIALLAGTFCYFVLIFMFRCIRKKDLYMMPGSKILEKLENILHIF